MSPELDELGKPEKLKGNFSGYCSRRITPEHRLVYKKMADFIIVAHAFLKKTYTTLPLQHL